MSCPGQRQRVDNQTGKATVQDTPPVTIPLTLIRINDIAIAGNASFDFVASKTMESAEPFSSNLVSGNLVENCYGLCCPR